MEVGKKKERMIVVWPNQKIKVSGNNFDDGKLFSIFMTTIVEIMGVSSVNSSS